IPHGFHSQSRPNTVPETGTLVIRGIGKDFPKTCEFRCAYEEPNHQNSSLLTLQTSSVTLCCAVTNIVYRNINLDYQDSSAHPNKLTPREQFALASKILRFRIRPRRH